MRLSISLFLTDRDSKEKCLDGSPSVLSTIDNHHKPNIGLMQSTTAHHPHHAIRPRVSVHSSELVKRLAEDSVPDTTYFVSSGKFNLNSVNQSMYSKLQSM